jgi:hypothetical protein
MRQSSTVSLRDSPFWWKALLCPRYRYMMTPRHAKPTSIPTICNNRANPATKGKPIGTPKPIQIPVNTLRITPLRRIDDRGNCGKSAACMHFTPSLLNFSTSYSESPRQKSPGYFGAVASNKGLAHDAYSRRSCSLARALSIFPLSRLSLYIVIFVQNDCNAVAASRLV